MYSIVALLASTVILSRVVNASVSMSWPFAGVAVTAQPVRSVAPEQNTTLTQAMAKVQQILENINTSPSCKRLAAKSLVDSCVRYDENDASTTRSTPEVLDIYQKLYGIRMSYCELEDAAQALPSACNGALALQPGNSIAESYIETCLEALYRDTNPWTTYMSMKTNAVIMCQAMRVERDKDEQLHFFQVLMSTTSDISAAMRNNAEDFDQLLMKFSALKDGMRSFHTELHKDNNEIKAAITESWDSIKKDMSGVSGDIHGLLKTMGDAKQDLDTYVSHIDNALSHAKYLSTQMDTRWDAGLVNIEEGLEKARDAYQYQLELHLAEFHRRVYAITNSVETANDLSSDLLGKLTLLNDDLDVPLEKVGELTAQANYLKEVQSAILKGFEDATNLTLANLVAASEHAAFFNTWMGLAVGLVRNFFDRIWPAVSTFLVWYAMFFLFVFKACKKIFGVLTGSIFALFATSALALMLTSFIDPIQLIKAFIDRHPTFFQETPPYLSMLVVFLGGVGTSLFVQNMCRSRSIQAYDPAAQLDSLPQFQDDLDLYELKHEYT